MWFKKKKKTKRVIWPRGVLVVALGTFTASRAIFVVVVWRTGSVVVGGRILLLNQGSNPPPLLSKVDS